jgi:hypothetical protein
VSAPSPIEPQFNLADRIFICLGHDDFSVQPPFMLARFFSTATPWHYWAMGVDQGRATSTIAHTRKTAARRDLDQPDVRFASNASEAIKATRRCTSASLQKRRSVSTCDASLCVRRRDRARVNRQAERLRRQARASCAVLLNSCSSSKTDVHFHKQRFTYMGKL